MKNNIVVDIGNTNTKLSYCDFESEKIKDIIIINNHQLDINVEEINLFINKYKYEKIVIGSVCQGVCDNLIDILVNKLSVDKKRIVNLNYKYFGDIYKDIQENPKDVGLDILALSYYLASQYKNSIGFCFGTVTFVTIVKNKKIKGVIIAPSFYSNFLSISQQVSMIDEIQIKNINKKSGMNTKECLESGYFHTLNGFVSSVIDTMNKKQEFTHAVFTGGVDFFAKNINKRNDIQFIYKEKQLVTIGYMLAYKNKKYH